MKRRTAISIAIIAVTAAGLIHEWRVESAHSQEETLRHDLEELRRMATAVDRLALSARSSSSSYDALVDTLSTLEKHSKRLVTPHELDAQRAPFDELLRARSEDVDAIKGNRSAARNTESYLASFVATAPAELNRALAAFLLRPDVETSRALLTAAPDDEALSRHLRIATETRLALNDLVREILKSGFAECTNQIEIAHAALAEDAHERARRVRLLWICVLLLLVFAQLWSSTGGPE